ncbi:unnamed protein product, partial [Mesorhabditis belari]|uniref:F-box domain-containing protein n=1 Tax=Mesorhabditis belari TaxID=2138241 RepID=A0AAF3F973_9BILA
MESLRKEQLNPTSSVNFLEALPDVLFYAVIEKLPARVIENTVRLLSRDCYRRVELRRARLPRVCFNWLDVYRNEFSYGFGTITSYKETIESTNLMHHLEYLAKRVTFKRLVLFDVDWEVFANCKALFRCEELACYIEETTLSPERFVDVFCRIRPTHQLTIFVNGDKQNVPVTSDFFTNNHAVGLQNVCIDGWGKAMVDPLNDTILSNFCLLSFDERQIDEINLRAVGGKAELQNFLRNLLGLSGVKLIENASTSNYHEIRLKRANGDVVQLNVDANVDASAPGSIGIYMRRKFGLTGRNEMPHMHEVTTEKAPLARRDAANIPTRYYDRPIDLETVNEEDRAAIESNYWLSTNRNAFYKKYGDKIKLAKASTCTSDSKETFCRSPPTTPYSDANKTHYNSRMTVAEKIVLVCLAVVCFVILLIVSRIGEENTAHELENGSYEDRLQAGGNKKPPQNKTKKVLEPAFYFPSHSIDPTPPNTSVVPNLEGCFSQATSETLKSQGEIWQKKMDEKELAERFEILIENAFSIVPHSHRDASRYVCHSCASIKAWD